MGGRESPVRREHQRTEPAGASAVFGSGLFGAAVMGGVPGGGVSRTLAVLAALMLRVVAVDGAGLVDRVGRVPGMVRTRWIVAIRHRRGEQYPSDEQQDTEAIQAGSGTSQDDSALWQGGP